MRDTQARYLEHGDIAIDFLDGTTQLLKKINLLVYEDEDGNKFDLKQDEFGAVVVKWRLPPLKGQFKPEGYQSPLKISFEENLAIVKAGIEAALAPSKRHAPLIEALELGLDIPSKPLEPTVMQIEHIDISGWSEFTNQYGENFFDKPEILKTLSEIQYEVLNLPETLPTRIVVPCTFLSVKSVDKERAIAELRKQLKLLHTWEIAVFGFLCKPCLFKGQRVAEENEVPDCEITVDLSGPQPGKKLWVAFCMIHAAVMAPLNPRLKEFCVTIGVQEGDAGSEV